MTTPNTPTWTAAPGKALKLRCGGKMTVVKAGNSIITGKIEAVPDKIYQWSYDGIFDARGFYSALDIVGEWEEPAPASPWRPYPEIQPTAADADDKGRVIYGWPNGHCTTATWDAWFAEGQFPDAWMPIPPREVSAPAPAPSAARALPILPEGFLWHRTDAITPEMIAEGYRPLIEGETRYPSDEYLPSESNLWVVAGSKLPLVTTYPGEWNPHRTKRALPELSMREMPLEHGDIPAGSLMRMFEEERLWYVFSTSKAGIVRHDNKQVPFSWAFDNREYLPPGADFQKGWIKCRKSVPTFSYSAESLPVPPPTAPAPAASPLPELFDIEEARRMLERHHDRIKALEDNKRILDSTTRQEVIDLIHKHTNSYLLHNAAIEGKPLDTARDVLRAMGVSQGVLSVLFPDEGAGACNSPERTVSE